MYNQAKDAYDRKDHDAAAKDFDRTIALIDEIGVGTDRALSDLRTLAGGFRDLAKAAKPAARIPAVASMRRSNCLGCKGWARS